MRTKFPSFFLTVRTKHPTYTESLWRWDIIWEIQFCICFIHHKHIFLYKKDSSLALSGAQTLHKVPGEWVWAPLSIVADNLQSQQSACNLHKDTINCQGQ